MPLPTGHAAKHSLLSCQALHSSPAHLLHRPRWFRLGRAGAQVALSSACGGFCPRQWCAASCHLPRCLPCPGCRARGPASAASAVRRSAFAAHRSSQEAPARPRPRASPSPGRSLVVWVRCPRPLAQSSAKIRRRSRPRRPRAARCALPPTAMSAACLGQPDPPAIAALQFDPAAHRLPTGVMATTERGTTDANFDGASSPSSLRAAAAPAGAAPDSGARCRRGRQNPVPQCSCWLGRWTGSVWCPLSRWAAAEGPWGARNRAIVLVYFTWFGTINGFCVVDSPNI